MITVTDLTKRYARTTAVDHISFSVNKGDIVGFLGPNGAGKTTTMRMLTCFFPPTSGKATVAGFDVERDPERLVWLHDIIDATDPDLTAFRRHNGKLIIYYGWADPQLNPMMAVEYYEDLTAEMGPTTDSFARLFMVPGCLHCGGGPGATDVDWLSAIVEWVEHTRAPDKLIASKRGPGTTVLTRPLYPYPQSAIYKGSGDPNSADSFVVKSPAGAGR